MVRRRRSTQRALVIAITYLPHLLSAANGSWGNCFGGHCYVLVPHASRDFDGATQSCNNRGGHLASVATQEEWEHILSLIPLEGADTWLGVRYEVSNEQALSPDQWEDGTIFDTALVQSNLEEGASPSINSRCLISKTSTTVPAWYFGACELEEETPVALHAVCKTFKQEHNYCYDIRWGDLQGTNGGRIESHELVPITRFPLTHPKSTGNCGKSVDGRIPSTGLWSSKGATSATASSCEEVTGGDLFYAYNHPKQFSSNVGYESKEALATFFVIDSSNQGYWVTTVDSPGNDDMGASDVGNGYQYAIVELNGTGLGGKGVKIIRADDPVRTPQKAETCTRAEVHKFEYDCYSWDEESGSGNFMWEWKTFSMDGMVLGPLPTTDFCMTLKVKDSLGLDSLVFGTFEEMTRGISFFEISLEDEVQVCGYACTDYCDTLTDCGSCAESSSCGWCTETGTCEPLGAAGRCNAGWTSKSSESASDCCDPCTAAVTCEECGTQASCGWSMETSECVSMEVNACSRIPEELRPTLLQGTCTAHPTATPTNAPTGFPSASPVTNSPTESPIIGTKPPTASPIPAPTASPNVSPTASPSSSPSDSSVLEPQIPTNSPVRQPTTLRCSRYIDCEYIDIFESEPGVSCNRSQGSGSEVGECTCISEDCSVFQREEVQDHVMERAQTGGASGEQSNAGDGNRSLILGLAVVGITLPFLFVFFVTRRRSKKKRDDDDEVFGARWDKGLDFVISNPKRRGESTWVPLPQVEEGEEEDDDLLMVNPMIDVGFRAPAIMPDESEKRKSKRRSRKSTKVESANSSGLETKGLEVSISTGDDNSLVAALKAQKRRLKIMTNNPTMALKLMQEVPSCESDCAEEGADSTTVNKRARESAWSCHLNPANKHTYYYNSVTNEISLTKPTTSVPLNTKYRTMRKWTFKPKNDELSQLCSLFQRASWYEYHDEATRRQYYINCSSKEAIWIRPI